MPNGNSLTGSSAVFAKRYVAGFAYIALLMAIALLGLFASQALQIGSHVGRRDAEQALLTIGAEFEQALHSYAGVKPAQIATSIDKNARGPKTLEELLKDSRNPSIKRHLRQIYADPLTGSADWGVIKDQAGFILGVYSNALGKPIKQANFSTSQINFEDAPNYATWIFGLPSAQVKTQESRLQQKLNN